MTEQKLLENVIPTIFNCWKNINAVIVSNNQGQVEWANKSFVENKLHNGGKEKQPGSFLQGPETDPETVTYLKDRISVSLIVKLLIILNGVLG
jgi:hypothetical protein